MSSILRLPRNVWLLATAQMLGSSGLTVVVILGGLVAAEIAPRPSLATVPVSLSIVATALTTIPAALLMRRVGRRIGFIIGALIGVGGGLVASRAVLRGDFELFCAATLLLGASMAFTQQYRFAAAESVPYSQVSRAVSWVLIGSLGAALLSPQLAIAAKNWLPQAQYAGSFIAVSLLYLLATLVLLRLELPAQPAASQRSSGASVATLFAKPQFRLAVLASAGAYATMSFLMTAAPISMHGFADHGMQATAWVIQSHVLAMYLPSLFTGHLVARWGERKVLLAGGLLLVLCVAISLRGQHLMHYWSGLVLLGAGWNLLFVAATTLLAQSTDPSESHRAQAVNDFVVFGSQACASLLAGFAVQQLGWQALNLAILPILVALLLAAHRLKLDTRDPATAAAATPSSSR